MTIPLHSWVARGGGKAGTTGPVLPTGPTLPPAGIAITDPAVIGPEGVSLFVHPLTGFEAIAENRNFPRNRIVAVGGQYGAPSGLDAGVGPPATCPGAAESFDGGKTWRDVSLPFDGQKQRYTHIKFYGGRSNAYWLATSKYSDAGVNVTKQYYADDVPAPGALTWKPAGMTTFGLTRSYAIESQVSMYQFGLKGGSGYVGAYDSAATNELDYPPTELPWPLFGAPLCAVSSVGWPDGGNSGADGFTRGASMFFGQSMVGSVLDSGTTPTIARTAPWASSLLDSSYVYAAAIDSQRKWGVVITSDRFNPATAQSNPPGRTFWMFRNRYLEGTGMGVGDWSQPGFNWAFVFANGGSPSLSGASTGNESYEAITYFTNGATAPGYWCAVGYDRNTFRSCVAIGRSASYGTAPPSSWSEYRIPDSRAWTGVCGYANSAASLNFVACSRDGHLLAFGRRST